MANCDIKSVMRTHVLEVTATFKDGGKTTVQEPKINDIFGIINQYKNKRRLNFQIRTISRLADRVGWVLSGFKLRPRLSNFPKSNRLAFCLKIFFSRSLSQYLSGYKK